MSDAAGVVYDCIIPKGKYLNFRTYQVFFFVRFIYVNIKVTMWDKYGDWSLSVNEKTIELIENSAKTANKIINIHSFHSNWIIEVP